MVELIRIIILKKSAECDIPFPDKKICGSLQLPLFTQHKQSTCIKIKQKVK